MAHGPMSVHAPSVKADGSRVEVLAPFKDVKVSTPIGDVAPDKKHDACAEACSYPCCSWAASSAGCSGNSP
jgi:hypothetical protein